MWSALCREGSGEYIRRARASLRRRYSYRSASIGSSCEAFRAGYRPKMMPTPALTASAAKTIPLRVCMVQPNFGANGVYYRVVPVP